MSNSVKLWISIDLNEISSTFMVYSEYIKMLIIWLVVDHKFSCAAGKKSLFNRSNAFQNFMCFHPNPIHLLFTVIAFPGGFKCYVTLYIKSKSVFNE